jgi:TonB family protein
LVLSWILVPPAMRGETTEETVQRFGYRGPTRYDRMIQLRYLPEGSPTPGAHRTLMGAIAALPDRPFNGSVVPRDEMRVQRKLRGAGGSSPVASEGEDAVARLRTRYGNLPTVQSEEVVVKNVVRPAYPAEAITLGLEGVVIVVAFVDEQGRVEDVALERSVHPLLDGAAIKAARATEFEPYMPGGTVQAVFVRIRYSFELLGTLPG